MTVSLHIQQLINTLCCVLKLCVYTLSHRACTKALLSIVFSLVFMSSAMATDATSREHAIEIAKEQTGGDAKVLSVATETDSNGNTLFSVKLLSNGRVRVFTIIKAQ